MEVLRERFHLFISFSSLLFFVFCADVNNFELGPTFSLVWTVRAWMEGQK